MNKGLNIFEICYDCGRQQIKTGKEKTNTKESLKILYLKTARITPNKRAVLKHRIKDLQEYKEQN
jgi:hypothetical protein